MLSCTLKCLMQEIFDQVLNTEDQAEKIISEARVQAEKIVSEAEVFYKDTLKSAREKNREELSLALEEIRREQDERVHSVLKDYENQWIDLVNKGDKKIAELAVKLAEMTASRA